MAMLERVREWLETYPGMARLSGFEVDELGTAAQLGGEGTQQGTARAEKGALSQNSEDGTATYEVALTIKFKKRYEV